MAENEAMLWRDRLANYRKQNGTKRLTPKQQKRLEKKKKRTRAARNKRRKK